MRWESGLHEAVRTANLVLSPSLWSSPCEGALIKNIVIAKAPGDCAFGAEDGFERCGHSSRAKVRGLYRGTGVGSQKAASTKKSSYLNHL